MTNVIAFSQQRKEPLIAIEIIVSDESGNVLKDVTIYNSKNELKGITNQEGIAWIYAYKSDTVIFSHLSFEPKAVKISEMDLYEKEYNNFIMIVTLKQNSYILPAVEIIEKKPQLAYENKEVWVLDYSVDEKGIVAVTSDGKKSYLLHLGFEQDTISIKEIDKKLDVLYREILYRDIFGNTHLMSLDSAYQIHSVKDNLQLLYGVTLEKHQSTFKSIDALTDSIVITKKKLYSGQEVVYFSTNRNTGKTEVLCDVYGSSREMAKNWRMDEIRMQRATSGGNEFAANYTEYERLQISQNVACSIKTMR